MTLEDLITETREILGDKTGRAWTRENVVLAINWACVEAAKKTKATIKIVEAEVPAGESSVVVQAIDFIGVALK